MKETKEEQSIEEYWDLFRDSLPGAESSVEAIYRILEILNRQVDAFSGCDERKERYPQLVTSRTRNQPSWKLTLTYWNHTQDESVTITSTGQMYSTVVEDLFKQVIIALKRDIERRAKWVDEAERELAALTKNLYISEKFCNSLGTYTPDQRNLPLGEGPKEAT